MQNNLNTAEQPVPMARNLLVRAEALAWGIGGALLAYTVFNPSAGPRLWALDVVGYVLASYAYWHRLGQKAQSPMVLPLWAVGWWLVAAAMALLSLVPWRRYRSLAELPGAYRALTHNSRR